MGTEKIAIPGSAGAFASQLSGGDSIASTAAQLDAKQLLSNKNVQKPQFIQLDNLSSRNVDSIRLTKK